LATLALGSLHRHPWKQIIVDRTAMPSLRFQVGSIQSEPQAKGSFRVARLESEMAANHPIPVMQRPYGAVRKPTASYPRLPLES
jgi:hypothetical protein